MTGVSGEMENTRASVRFCEPTCAFLPFVAAAFEILVLWILFLFFFISFIFR